MMDEKLLHQKLYEESTDELNSYDRLNFENNLKFYTEGVNEMMSAVLVSKADIQKEMIDQSIENLRNMVVGVPEMGDFFGNVRNALALKNVPITTKVYNTAVIEKIRPQYLMQISNEIAVTIDRYLKGSISSDDIDRQYLNDGYLINCKKQMVKTSIPYDIDPKGLAKYDAGVIVDANETYITANIVPFLRNVPNYIKEMEIISANSVSAINDAYNTISAVLATVDNLFKDERITIKQYRDLNKYLYKIVRIFMRAVSYLTFAVIKKISTISASIKSYKDLQTKILNYFPDGDKVLHESAITDGFDDLDYGDVVNNVIQNNSSAIQTIISAITAKAIDQLTYAYGSDMENPEGFINTQIGLNQYSKAPYAAANEIIKAMIASIDSIRQNAKDQSMPCDDIVTKSGLSGDLVGRFSALTAKISDTSEYDNLIHSNFDSDDKQRIYFMILHELSDGNTNVENIVSQISLMYNTFKDLQNDLDHGDVDQFKNIETAKELADFVGSVEPQIRQVILSIMRALIGRSKSLASIVDEIGESLGDNNDVLNTYGENASEDFFDFVIEASAEVNDLVNEIVFESYLAEYTKIRTFYETGMKVVFEDGLATNANATNSTSNNNTQSNGEKKSIGQSIKDRLKHLVEIITNFFTKSKNMVTEIVRKQSGNLKILKEHRDEICNRSFSGVTINVIPYEQNVTIDSMVKDINTMRDKINGISAQNLKNYNSKRNLHGYLFSFLEGGAGNKEDVADTLKTYYKVKNNKLEVMPYKGGQAKALMPTMVDYCISYYSDGGEQMQRAFDDLQNAVNEKIESLESMKLESVMYEAETGSAAQTQQPAQQPTTQAPATDQSAKPANASKPSVSVQKSADTATVKGDNTDKNAGNSYEILKWITNDVQVFSAAIMGAARDRNYDYLKIINSLLPKSVKDAIQAGNEDVKKNDQNTTNESTDESGEYEVFTEKLQREKYVVDQFKRDYKYDPKDKTIVVDGNKYKVDLEYNKYIADADEYGKIPRQTLSANSVDKKVPTKIILDKGFFELKNNARRRAVLQHEIGHARMMSAGSEDRAGKSDNVNSRTLKNNFNNNKEFPSLYKSAFKSITKPVKADKNDPEAKKEETRRMNMRADLSRKSAKKVPANNTNPHFSAPEVEADAYAVHRTSSSDLKKGLREAMRKATKDKSIIKSAKGEYKAMDDEKEPVRKKWIRGRGAGLSKDELNDARKQLNIQNAEDYKLRMKALKDRKLTNHKYLRQLDEDDAKKTGKK